MCPSTSCPLSSFTRNIVFGRASVTSPSISIFSSLVKLKCRAVEPPADAGGGRWARSYLGDVDRLGSLVASLLLVGDLAVLRERLEAGAVDTGVVDEEIAITLVRSDEPVALLVVEPLHRARCH